MTAIHGRDSGEYGGTVVGDAEDEDGVDGEGEGGAEHQRVTRNTWPGTGASEGSSGTREDMVDGV